ncbi:UDP-N-acetyl-D-glucosamine dehydrogenase [Streptomyces yokosukanensis]|uniref:UDP-N-acetyl-D-glucosamine dehydrogenase n=1 Tax=Streptomyces yokosukanensis TaxID=67386 RepID=A0A101NRJ7_9ACTN|nr:nucleotide sugar dehydrogenase [Streptomyces yokosukanensis]KUM98064.1 UDP-N-acetyl-D-glucosamine dehydrogenase [Streptomyces yokosukanensis]
MITETPGKALISAITHRTAVIGVVGLGYVGLSNAVAFAEAGFRVIGIDIESERVAKINRGESHLEHVPGEAVAEQVRAQRLSAATDFDVVSTLDCVLVCVPTPVRRDTVDPEPDLSHVRAAAQAIAPRLKPGSLVVLESTTFAGTTEDVLRPLLEASGLVAGRDFLLGYAPERIDPGNRQFALESIPRLVSGHGPDCQEAVRALYSQVFESVRLVSSIRAAEVSKLFENTFRWVNIGLVNELKMMCDSMGLDVWEVISAASTKPFGFLPFFPGPGVGGHCIPVDPYYLAWNARQVGMEARFVSLAGRINSSMPGYVVQRTAEALLAHDKELTGARLLVAGVAYKRDVDDIRESPSLEIMRLLGQEGATVDYHDPHVPQLPENAVGPDAVKSKTLSTRLAAEYDAVLILVDHSDIDWEQLVGGAPLVIDTRNVTERLPRLDFQVVRG